MESMTDAIRQCPALIQGRKNGWSRAGQGKCNIAKGLKMPPYGLPEFYVAIFNHTMEGYSQTKYAATRHRTKNTPLMPLLLHLKKEAKIC